MLSPDDLCALIRRGGVYRDVEGNTVPEVLAAAVSRMGLPAGLDGNLLLAELVEREGILSTAVGNGIALPHPHRKLVADPADQRVAVCFLKDPIDMQAPDARKVYVYFILLTADSQQHVEILSGIASLAKDRDFRSLLEGRPDEEALLAGIRRSLA